MQPQHDDYTDPPPPPSLLPPFLVPSRRRLNWENYSNVRRAEFHPLLFSSPLLALRATATAKKESSPTWRRAFFPSPFSFPFPFLPRLSGGRLDEWKRRCLASSSGCQVAPFPLFFLSPLLPFFCHADILAQIRRKRVLERKSAPHQPPFPPLFPFPPSQFLPSSRLARRC